MLDIAIFRNHYDSISNSPGGISGRWVRWRQLESEQFWLAVDCYRDNLTSRISGKEPFPMRTLFPIWIHRFASLFSFKVPLDLKRNWTSILIIEHNEWFIFTLVFFTQPFECGIFCNLAFDCAKQEMTESSIIEVSIVSCVDISFHNFSHD